MARFPTIGLSIAALALAAFAAPAAAQTAPADNHGPTDRPILVFGAVAQDQHSGPTDRPILVFGAIGQDDHRGPTDRPILVFGAIKDRGATQAADDPADRALPAMPVVYEDDTGQ